MSDEDVRLAVARVEYCHTMEKVYDRIWSNYRQKKAHQEEMSAAQSWKNEAYKQKARAEHAEQQLAAEANYALELRKYADGLLERIETLKETNTRYMVEGINCAIKLGQLEETLAEELRGLREELDHRTHETEATRNRNIKLQHQVDTAQTQIHALEQANDRLNQTHQVALQTCQSNGAMAAGFEAIYKALMLEVIAKHDPSTLASLDPKKRISIMDDAWLAFVQSGMHEHTPDLKFAYTDAGADASAKSDAVAGPANIGEAGQMPPAG